MTTLPPPAIDLPAYLARIGHANPVAPDLATLRALVAAHAARIPFENLDPLMGRTPSLAPEAIQRKLVAEGRGGWCFEHNALLRHVLEAIGFRVTGLAARVLWNQPAGAVTPRSHMVLRVDLPEGAYVVDVGFGGLTLTGVLRLDDEGAQATPHEPFRLVPEGGAFRLEAEVREAWMPLYRFDLTPQLAPDYEITNYYLANAPASHFTKGLLCARAVPGARYALRNGQLAIHREGSPSETLALPDAAAIREALETHFELRLPEGPELDVALAKAVAAAKPQPA